MIEFEISSKENLPIKCDLLTAKTNEKKPLAIIVHGFKSFRRWGFNPYLLQKFNDAGLNSLAFDFSRNGIDDEEKMLYNVDLFRKNTVGIAIDDLNTLFDHLPNLESLQNTWNGEIYLCGHSMGGAISILSSPNREEVKKISLWGAISKWDRNTRRQKKEWQEKGYMEFKENSTGQMLYLDYEYLAYKERNAKKIDIRENLSNLDIPIQVIHGEQDFTVPAKEGEILHKKSKNPASEIHIIPKTGHTFGIRHPMKESNPGLDDAINQTINFFEK